MEAGPERWITPANVVTALRIPLAALLWAAPAKPLWVAAVVVAAGLSDGIDGFLARRQDPGGGRKIGEWLDPLCDKIFMLSAVGVLAYGYGVPLWISGLLLTRDLLLALFVLVRKLAGRSKPQGPMVVRAAWIGKITTAAQFATVLTLLAGHVTAVPLAVVTGILGAGSAVYYARRSMKPASA